jgi:Peptidase family M23
VTPHRTIPLLLALLLSATGAALARVGNGGVPRLVFPLVGAVDYHDDFGEPRPGGPHQGNDLLAAKRSPAVAAEGGTVQFWTTSAGAGCMLYLHGDSGTTYLYIHLNNDVTLADDNRGKCVAGTAYAPGLKDGDRVEAGQLVGFVGDSGDADGLHAHLHFEVHPHDGKAVDPFPFLRKARHLLVAMPPAGGAFTLQLDGTVVSTDGASLKLAVDTLRSWPSHLKVTKVGRTLTVAVADDAQILPASLDDAYAGEKVSVWTLPAPATMPALTGAPGALSARKIQLR